jgi:hypothetical protein
MWFYTQSVISAHTNLTRYSVIYTRRVCSTTNKIGFYTQSKISTRRVWFYTQSVVYICTYACECDTQESDNDSFECYFYMQSVIPTCIVIKTRTNVITTLTTVISTRTRAECDFDTHEYDLDPDKLNFDRMRVTLTWTNQN